MSRYVKFGELVDLEKHKPSGRPQGTNVDANVPTSSYVGVHKKTVGTHIHKDRHKPGRVRLHCRLDSDIMKKIKHFCADRNIQLQDFVELVAAHYFECVGVHKSEKVGVHKPHDDLMIRNTDDLMISSSDDVGVHKSEKVGVHTSHDDLMIRKTDDDIIMLYQRYTENKWKSADDRAARALNNIDRRIIEIGILNTLLNARGKRINSFAYFLPEIQTLIEINLHKETIDVYLERRRQQWQALENQHTK